MADVKMNDFTVNSDFGYGYCESSAGAQSKVSKDNMKTALNVNFGYSSLANFASALNSGSSLVPSRISAQVTTGSTYTTNIKCGILLFRWGGTSSACVLVKINSSNSVSSMSFMSNGNETVYKINDSAASVFNFNCDSNGFITFTYNGSTTPSSASYIALGLV